MSTDDVILHAPARKHNVGVFATEHIKQSLGVIQSALYGTDRGDVNLFFGEETTRVERFVHFHHVNPLVYRYFCRFAEEMRQSLYSRWGGSGEPPHYGANAIIERIRWHIDLQTEDPNAEGAVSFCTTVGVSLSARASN